MMMESALIETSVPGGKPDLQDLSEYLRACPIDKIRSFEGRIIFDLDCGGEYDSMMLSFSGEKVSHVDFGPPPPPFNIAPRPLSRGGN